MEKFQKERKIPSLDNRYQQLLNAKTQNPLRASSGDTSQVKRHTFMSHVPTKRAEAGYTRAEWKAETSVRS